VEEERGDKAKVHNRGRERMVTEEETQV